MDALERGRQAAIALSFRGRLIREADVAFLRALIAQHPELNRRQLSVQVCAAYRHHLHRIAYNTRFLIVPWVEVPGLASHLLSRITRRLSADGQARYHHRIDLLESFVDLGRFPATGYRATNWIWVGRSAGWGTKSHTPGPTVSIKELWVYPLNRHFRQHWLEVPPAGPKPLPRGADP